MKQWQRLREKRQFQAIFSHGYTWTSNLLVLKGLPNSLEYNRYAFAVGKRLGKAVIRNRIKRRLRECVPQIPLRTGWDLVLIARQGAASVEYQVLKDTMRQVFDKACLLGEET